MAVNLFVQVDPRLEDNVSFAVLRDGLNLDDPWLAAAAARQILERFWSWAFRQRHYSGNIQMNERRFLGVTGYRGKAPLWELVTDPDDGWLRPLGNGEYYIKGFSRYQKLLDGLANGAKRSKTYRDKNKTDADWAKAERERSRLSKRAKKPREASRETSIFPGGVHKEGLKTVAEVLNSEDFPVTVTNGDLRLKNKDLNPIHQIPRDLDRDQDHMPQSARSIVTADEAQQAADDFEAELTQLAKPQPSQTPEPVMDDAKAKKPKEEPTAKQPTAPSGETKGKSAGDLITEQILAMAKRLAVPQYEDKGYAAAYEDGATPAGQMASKAKAPATPKSASLPWPQGIPKPQNLAAHPSPQEFGAFCSAVGWHARAQRMHLLEAQLVGLTWADLQAAWADGRPKSLGYVVLLTMSQRGVANPREALERLKCSLRHGSETSLTSTPKDAPQANHAPVACPVTGRADPLLH